MVKESSREQPVESYTLANLKAYHSMDSGSGPHDISTKDSANDISLYIQDYLYNMQDNIRQWKYTFLEGCAPPRFGLTSDCCDNLRRSNVVVGKLHYNFIK